MNDYRLIHGDCLEVLPTLADGSVQCCVTSPPYWGLRDYGTAKWDGGDAECDHKQSTARKDAKRSGVDGFHGSTRDDSDKGAMNYRDICGKCGARRIDSQLGLESTPDEYVAKMVAVFREVRRVLADDGVLFVNLGDSYASNGAGSWGSSSKSTLTTGSKHGHWAPGKTIGNVPVRNCSGLKPKDLVGIPWRVAFALQADGWWLRQDIIWAKPNPMPESVTDRCTKAHEYLFLLAKSERYRFDAKAIAEESVTASNAPRNRWDRDYECPPGQTPQKRVGRSGNAERKDAIERGCPSSGVDGNVPWEGSTRNKRSVWTVAAKPFAEAHFATFPEKLIEPCILAGCPIGGTVLDPFNGAGTTGLVATRHGRNYVGIELNPDYLAMADRRIREACPLFAQGAEP